MAKIAIIGRRNVGKSTLFNTLLRKRVSIEYDQPGVTRDLIEYDTSWIAGQKLTLVDFPGFENLNSKDIDLLEKIAIEKAMAVLDQFQLILWVVSIHGLTPFENELLKEIRKKSLNTWLVVNFVDDPKLESEASDFYSLGFENTWLVSGLNKRKIVELRNGLIEKFQAYKPSDVNGLASQEDIQNQDEGKTKKNNLSDIKIKTLEQENWREASSQKEHLQIAIIGKPNAGKSTFFNALCGKDKALISDIPGTTRDSLNTTITANSKKYTVIDTAGMRKRKKILESVEFFSVARAKQNIKNADFVFFVLDIREGLDRQNIQILELIEEELKPAILLINKYDLIDNKDYYQRNTYKDFEAKLNKFWNIPVFFMSAIEKKVNRKLFENMERLLKLYHRDYKTSALNKIMESISSRGPWDQNKFKVRYITKAKKNGKFILFSNKENPADNTKKYIENQIKRRLFANELPCFFEWRKSPSKERPS